MLTNMLFIFLPLLVGYLITIKSPQWLHYLNKSTSSLIYVILFLMGLSLATLDNLSENLRYIVTMTSLFFVLISSCNIAALLFIDTLFPIQTNHHHKKISLVNMVLESVSLIAIVGSGLAINIIFSFEFFWIKTANEWILSLLLFFIGIQLRNSGLTLKQILLNKHGMIIAAIVVFTSWIGGLLSAIILDIPLSHGLAMASGFGWYSLSGILIGDVLGPVYGGASFMLELSRELMALILIPLLIRKKACTAIGYAGATAMDFTLPIIQTTGGVKCVPIAIVSGFILSLLVPVLMLFFASLGA